MRRSKKIRKYHRKKGGAGYETINYTDFMKERRDKPTENKGVQINFTFNDDTQNFTLNNFGTKTETEQYNHLKGNILKDITITYKKDNHQEIYSPQDFIMKYMNPDIAKNFKSVDNKLNTLSTYLTCLTVNNRCGIEKIDEEMDQVSNIQLGFISSVNKSPNSLNVSPKSNSANESSITVSPSPVDLNNCKWLHLTEINDEDTLLLYNYYTMFYEKTNKNDLKKINTLYQTIINDKNINNFINNKTNISIEDPEGLKQLRDTISTFIVNKIYSNKNSYTKKAFSVFFGSFYELFNGIYKTINLIGLALIMTTLEMGPLLLMPPVLAIGFFLFFWGSVIYIASSILLLTTQGYKKMIDNLFNSDLIQKELHKKFITIFNEPIKPINDGNVITKYKLPINIYQPIYLQKYKIKSRNLKIENDSNGNLIDTLNNIIIDINFIEFCCEVLKKNNDNSFTELNHDLNYFKEKLCEQIYFVTIPINSPYEIEFQVMISIIRALYPINDKVKKTLIDVKKKINDKKKDNTLSNDKKQKIDEANLGDINMQYVDTLNNKNLVNYPLFLEFIKKIMDLKVQEFKKESLPISSKEQNATKDSSTNDNIITLPYNPLKDLKIYYFDGKLMIAEKKILNYEIIENSFYPKVITVFPGDILFKVEYDGHEYTDLQEIKGIQIPNDPDNQKKLKLTMNRIDSKYKVIKLTKPVSNEFKLTFHGIKKIDSKEYFSKPIEPITRKSLYVYQSDSVSRSSNIHNWGGIISIYKGNEINSLLDNIITSLNDKIKKIQETDITNKAEIKKEINSSLDEIKRILTTDITDENPVFIIYESRSYTGKTVGLLSSIGKKTKNFIGKTYKNTFNYTKMTEGNAKFFNTTSKDGEVRIGVVGGKRRKRTRRRRKIIKA
jgi:hypothetical protein